MPITLREGATTAICVPTSMGVRLTPPDGQPVQSANAFHLQVTSAETNVAGVSSCLGLPVKVLTNFVQGSPIAALIKNNLLSRRMNFEGPELPQGGPWGYRHQFNIADSGFGARGPRVWNDRAGEVSRILRAEDFDLERIFAREGVQILHMSGLIAALSPETGVFCLALAQAAKRHGAIISFDLNHRTSFWAEREVALQGLFTQIAGLSDILAGNEEDFQLSLGIQGPESGGHDLAGKISNYQDMIDNVKKEYPHVSVFTTTLRQVESAGSHLWGAILHENGHWYVAEPRKIAVLDRIGGGDAFMGGVLYAMLRGFEPERWVQFGWACGALAVTMLTDYIQPADEEQIWSVWEGNARVIR